MEFLRTSRRRTVLSEAVYILLNIALAVAVLELVRVFNSPLPAFGLVLLSKWRVLAVRPHYWGAHIVANMVDIIVGLSMVVFLFAAMASLPTQIGLVVLYIIWLLFIKPRSKHTYVVAQGSIALFLGIAALDQMSYDWWASGVVLATWIIGYSAARHILIGAYKEPHAPLISLIWGLVMAEIGWMTYHWTIAYDLRFAGALQLSQAAIISLLLSFLAERAYASYRANSHVRVSDIVLPALLSISVIILLITVFGSVHSI